MITINIILKKIKYEWPASILLLLLKKPLSPIGSIRSLKIGPKKKKNKFIINLLYNNYRRQ